jgi:hypothetical protein
MAGLKSETRADHAKHHLCHLSSNGAMVLKFPAHCTNTLVNPQLVVLLFQDIEGEE